MTKKAVIYARYSCEKQTEQSIEGQLRVCNEFVERNGYTTIIMVIFFLSSIHNSSILPVDMGSSALVGSSIKRICGSTDSARAIQSLCC